MNTNISQVQGSSGQLPFGFFAWSIQADIIAGMVYRRTLDLINKLAESGGGQASNVTNALVIPDVEMGVLVTNAHTAYLHYLNVLQSGGQATGQAGADLYSQQRKLA